MRGIEMKELLVLGIGLMAMGCGQEAKDTGANSNPGSFPYTPQGCAYTVATPSSIEEVSMGASATGADPTPKHIHVSWAGAPESTFAVNWATDLDTKLTQVLYGTDQATVESADAAGEGVSVQVGHTMLFSSPLLVDQKTRVHEVHICGLSPDTTYYYKVGGAGHWSQVYDVATAPPPASVAPFKFLLTGDSRSGSEIYAQIMEKAKDQGIDFQIFSGDFIDNTTNQTHWEAFFEGTTGSYSTQDLIASRPLMPVNGNHDNLSVYYTGQFALPQELSPGEVAEGEEWYSFDYANAHFLMLNSENSQLDGPQADWMKADLDKVDRGKTPWIIASFHTTPYTCGSTHQSDSDKPRAMWQPIFDQYKVDLVLNGHVHNYQRSVPIRGFQPGTTDGIEAASGPNKEPVSESGTVYIVAAGASGDLYNVDPPETCSYSYRTEKVNNYAMIEIDNRTLHFQALRLDGTEIDSFDYTK
jgi:Purple acid Phosphatase, N-terminal domain/Calcineurin-like phosphoesterase